MFRRVHIIKVKIKLKKSKENLEYFFGIVQFWNCCQLRIMYACLFFRSWSRNLMDYGRATLWMTARRQSPDTSPPTMWCSWTVKVRRDDANNPIPVVFLSCYIWFMKNDRRGQRFALTAISVSVFDETSCDLHRTIWSTLCFIDKCYSESLYTLSRHYFFHSSIFFHANMAILA